MKVKATIEYNCGRYTCAFTKGGFCEYVAVERFGTIPVCILFSSEGRHTVLKEDHKEGSLLMRCDACLKACDPNITSTVIESFLGLTCEQKRAICIYLDGPSDHAAFVETIKRRGNLAILMKEVDKVTNYKGLWEPNNDQVD